MFLILALKDSKVDAAYNLSATAHIHSFAAMT